MAAKAIRDLLKSGFATTAGFSMLGTAAYVLYKDGRRYTGIEEAFSRGNLLPPLADNQNEIAYFHRPTIEAQVRHLLRPSFSNEYYLINGEVGTGKTRLIVEAVRDMMKTDGNKGNGAPVYVLASQGKSFPDSLASAVQFTFDEHINFKFFIGFLLRIDSMPEKDERNKLRRVLDAIEEAAYIYMQKTGRPAVIVIDGVQWISSHTPGGLQRIQEKAKLWADTNIAKIVFVTNDDETELIMQNNQSSWSRANSPLYIGDLSHLEALRFLQRETFHEEGYHQDHQCRIMDVETAEGVVNLVGGRIQHLLQFRRDWSSGLLFEETAERLKCKEREKLLETSRSDSAMKALEMLKAAKNKQIKLHEFIKRSSWEDVALLLKHNIVTIVRQPEGMMVRFESVLVENALSKTS